MVRRLFLLVTMLGVVILPNVSTFAASNQSVPPMPNSTPLSPGSSTRIALVIGNASYPKDPLPFAINDARDMAQALSDVGFDVTVATDVNLKRMMELTTDFVRKALTAKVALVYFAGHGEGHVEGAVVENFLLPVEVVPGQGQGNFATSIPVTSTLLNPLATSIEKRISIVILDACRTQSVTHHPGLDLNVPSLYQRGLAEMVLPSGTFVAYGAAPGTAAFESLDAQHGRFTQSLLKHMRTPGLSIEQVFKRVRSDVEQMSDFKQSPREESSLRGDQDFSFVDSTNAARAGRITPYIGQQEPAPRSSNVTAQSEVLDTIRTTPAPSRMRALKKLIETRAPKLSVLEAEKVLSYFWITARSKALRTLTPQLPAAMPLEDVARLLQKTEFRSVREDPRPSFEELKSKGIVGGKKSFGALGNDEKVAKETYDQYLAKSAHLYEPQQMDNQELFTLLKLQGKVHPAIQYSQLADKLRVLPSKDRCAEAEDQDALLLDASHATQAEKLSNIPGNQQLFQLAQDKSIVLGQKRQRIKALLESKNIELSFNEVVEIIKEFPGETRNEVLTQDLANAIPDYVTWSDLPMLLTHINKSVMGRKMPPRGELISAWVDEGKLNANLTRHERMPIEKLIHEELVTGMKGSYNEVLPELDEAARSNALKNGLSAEQQEGMKRYMQMMNKNVESVMPMIAGQLAGPKSQILDRVMACNERPSVSIPKK